MKGHSSLFKGITECNKMDTIFSRIFKLNNLRCVYYEWIVAMDVVNMILVKREMVPWYIPSRSLVLHIFLGI